MKRGQAQFMVTIHPALHPPRMALHPVWVVCRACTVRGAGRSWPRSPYLPIEADFAQESSIPSLRGRHDTNLRFDEPNLSQSEQPFCSVTHTSATGNPRRIPRASGFPWRADNPSPHGRRILSTQTATVVEDRDRERQNPTDPGSIPGLQRGLFSFAALSRPCSAYVAAPKAPVLERWKSSFRARVMAIVAVVNLTIGDSQ